MSRVTHLLRVGKRCLEFWVGKNGIDLPIGFVDDFDGGSLSPIGTKRTNRIGVLMSV